MELGSVTARSDAPLICRRRGDEAPTFRSLFPVWLEPPHAGSYGIFLRRLEPVEDAGAGTREGDLILQIGEVQHRRIRDARPGQQVGTLLQAEIRGGPGPTQREVGGHGREIQLR